MKKVWRGFYRAAVGRTGHYRKPPFSRVTDATGFPPAKWTTGMLPQFIGRVKRGKPLYQQCPRRSGSQQEPSSAQHSLHCALRRT